MKVQSLAETIGKYACLAFCYIYCAGIKQEDQSHYIDLVIQAMNNGILDNECTVLNASKLIKFVSGKNCYVSKRDISSIEDIKEPTPVRFTNNGFGHWVVVANGVIVFDSLDNSKCVKYGKPTSARVITWR